MANDAQISAAKQLAYAVARAAHVSPEALERFALVYLTCDDQIGVVSSGDNPTEVVGLLAEGTLHVLAKPAADITYRDPV